MLLMTCVDFIHLLTTLFTISLYAASETEEESYSKLVVLVTAIVFLLRKENHVKWKNHYKKGEFEWISFSKNLCKSTLQKLLSI